jgi:hypothetical protein
MIAQPVNPGDTTLISNILVKLKKTGRPVYTEYNYTGKSLSYTVLIGKDTITQTLANGASATAFQALFPPTEFLFDNGPTKITLPWRYYANVGYFTVGSVTDPPLTQLKIWVNASDLGKGNVDIYYYYDEKSVPGFKVLTWPQSVTSPKTKQNLYNILTWALIGAAVVGLLVWLIIVARRHQRGRKSAKIVPTPSV